MIIFRRSGCFDNDYSDILDLLPIHYFNRSERMRELHRQGRYLGTSRIGEWNQSEEKKERMKERREQNSKDKSSTGYGSERKMRLDNKNLLLSQYNGQSGYLYFLDFPSLDSVKVGFSKNWEFRTGYQLVSKKSQIKANVIAVIEGPVVNLAELEYNLLINFIDYTRLDSTGTRYTEYLDRKVKQSVYDYLKDAVKRDTNLNFIINNNI